MKKLLILICLLSLTIQSIGQKLENSTYNPDGLKTFFQQSEFYGFSGAVVIAKGDNILLKKGYGTVNRRVEQPVNTKTVFSLASLDKSFIAVAVLKLEEMGKLSVDDKLSMFFDYIPVDKSTITLHHLLSHTSGLEAPYWDASPQLSKREFIKMVLVDRPLQFKPGEQWSYNNAGFYILEEVIEKVSGILYEDFLDKFIFVPSGMKHTGYPDDVWKEAQVAKYQWWTKDIETLDAKDLLNRPRYLWVMMSTIDDMYKWYLALKNNTILSQSSTKKMFTEVNNYNYGYGWNIETTNRGTALVHHGGSGAGVGMNVTFRWFLEEDLFICILSNSTNTTIVSDYFSADIENQLFGGSVQMPPMVNKEIKSIEIAGKYSFSTGGNFEIKKTLGNRLVVTSEDPTAIIKLHFPDAALLKQEDTPQDEIGLKIIRAMFKDDFEPLREHLSKGINFDAEKSYYKNAIKRISSMGDLLSISTVYQRPFQYKNAWELLSYNHLIFEKGEMILRVIHDATGGVSINAERMNTQEEMLLVPTIGGRYSTWDFKLGSGAYFDLRHEKGKSNLYFSGQHGTVACNSKE